ncbi:hypothetical protein M3P36_11905 [Altererythrobacter sp. KTW20L]|uniref:hypothetical protein n=1 Tax=Altererythrobacter sp. KTW20L TaxID=2942210 RepID=UPI0020BF0B91|nr:hypothetical protein [Altererythrobacter sp. KTW20L]MCL6251741.1 hypothetical protein [Altererythrobacter sp. KTW20L]
MHSTLHTCLALTLATAGMVVAPPVAAQEKAPASVADAFANLEDEAKSPDPEAETRAKLNREQAEFAARQLAENEASRLDVERYEREMREHEATLARMKAEEAAAQQAYEDERLRREREHEAAMDRWRADVAACQRGDLSRCAPLP